MASTCLWSPYVYIEIFPMHRRNTFKNPGEIRFFDQSTFCHCFAWMAATRPRPPGAAVAIIKGQLVSGLASSSDHWVTILIICIAIIVVFIIAVVITNLWLSSEYQGWACQRAPFWPPSTFLIIFWARTNIFLPNPLGHIFVHHILSRRIFLRHIVSGHADSAD